jgi:hypothetical protein
MEIKPEEKVIIKYSSYTLAQKRATQKYRQNNKDKVNEQRKKYYQTRKEKDPEFLEYKRLKAKEYYQRKKVHAEPEKIIEAVEIHDTEHEPEPIIEIHIPEPEIKHEEVVQVKQKRIRKKKEVVPPFIEQVVEPVVEEPKKEEPKKKKGSRKSKEV